MFSYTEVIFWMQNKYFSYFQARAYSAANVKTKYFVMLNLTACLMKFVEKRQRAVVRIFFFQKLRTFL
jgi:hypothetical protein